MTHAGPKRPSASSRVVIALCFMDTDKAASSDLTILRSAFENGTPLGWAALHSHQHGVDLNVT